MIVTVTANPMLEHLFPVKDLRAGGVYRPEQSWTFATGKGLNVARGLSSLGDKVTAVLAVGRRRGRDIEEMVEQEGLPHRCVAIRKESRVGFTTFEPGRTTTVYGPSPSLDDSDVDAIVATVRGLLPARCVVLAGSVTHPGLYPRLCALGAPVALDFDHPCLDECMELGSVLLAKPNREECLGLFGHDDPLRAVRDLARRGARWSVITDGPGPALFMTGGRIYRAHPPDVERVHPVGSGDALCAGLLHGLSRGPRDAIALAMACAAHNASRPEVGKLDPAACELLAGRVRIEEI